jgi:alpha-1,3-mannosyl-glycoprotein beta-1,2-N-acetylglucosaminyltransferase
LQSQNSGDISRAIPTFVDNNIEKTDTIERHDVTEDRSKQQTGLVTEKVAPRNSVPLLPPTPSLRRAENRVTQVTPEVKREVKQEVESLKTPTPCEYLGLSTLLLIIASNRPDYLQRSLKYVVDYHPRTAVPILISQDGDHPRVNTVVSEAKSRFASASQLPFNHIHFEGHGGYENGYFRLADHFKFALNAAFSGSYGNIERVIILEEDLQIAPDFYEFFAATAPLLDREKSLLTVSAWNDNGFKSQVKDEKVLYRSDFFPGLGWMMTKSLWQELQGKWPRAYWDDWLREPKQRQGRQILRPEVCRTLHFGAKGVSNAQYSDYLTQIRLNDQFVPFSAMDLTYLQEDKWDRYYLESVRKAPLLNLREATAKVENPSSLTDNEKENGIRVQYNSLDEMSHQPDSFSALARWSGAMNNVKAMVPRTAYKGVVSLYKNGVKVHLIPSDFI